jgi:hypothetical protein
MPTAADVLLRLAPRHFLFILTSYSVIYLSWHGTCAVRTAQWTLDCAAAATTVFCRGY